MRHYGDICEISGAGIEPVDCIIGGSPCQDLSIAGKRAGLAGARSGLYMEQIRIIREMREHDRKTGRTGQFIRPRYMVWENVVGAQSSQQGRDFAAVIEEAIRVAEPEAPNIQVPDKGWPTWGGYRDVDGRWSVAWRVLDAQWWGVPQRRRRIALVADFGGTTAHEILFNTKGVHGHPETGREAGERSSERTERGTHESGAGVGQKSVFCVPINDKATRFSGGGDTRKDDGAGNGLGVGHDGEPSPTLTAADRHGVYCAGFKLGNSEQARSIGYSEELAQTLNAECGGNKPAILDMSHANDVIRECGDVVPTLQSRMGTGGNQVPLTFQQNGFGDYKQADTASSCKQRDYKDSTDLCNQYGIVRRLTPTECERLQGFPDGWTDIGAWTDEKGKLHKESSDSARYKALGNSIALPPWKWVLKRLCAQYERDATMGSLFDGIGGSPLIWMQLNGWNSIKWASEIEPFCIAVTKRHFGDENGDGDAWKYLMEEETL